MPWFKTDDAFWRHPKVRRLGRDRLPAVGLWQLCGTWCADNVLTNVADGFVPDSQIELWDGKHKYANRLVDVDLWDRVEVAGENGYLFHDWPEYNPTKAGVETEREAWRERQAKARKKKSQGESRVTDAGVQEGVTGKSPSPVPVPVPSSGSVGRGATEPARASAPPPRCPKHINDPHPPACRACGEARRAAEASDSEQAAAAAKAQRDCVWCNAAGDRLVKGSRAMPVTPYVRCDHTRDQLDRIEAS